MALLNTAASGYHRRRVAIRNRPLIEKTLATNHLIFGELTDALTLPHDSDNTHASNNLSHLS
ncbi:MAG: hypothetical protein R2867_47605 [Caldilineaceae bacterium]